MDKMQILWSGESELPVGWALQPHAHDFFHLAYTIKGQLVLHTDNATYPQSEGSLILLAPGVVHTVPKDTHDFCLQYEVMFRLTDPALQRLFETENALVLHNAAHLEPLLSYICQHYKSVDPLCLAGVHSFLHTLLYSLLTGNRRSEGNAAGYVALDAYSPLIRNILCYVEKHSDKKYDLAALALTLGFNKTYLCTAFRRETGITISEYINYHRIREILITLQYNGYNKEVPIRELADQFGFRNASYFNRIFKTYTGLTPTEFMNALTNKADNTFRKYYNDHLDLNRYPIRESLAYMRGLQAAATLAKVPCKAENDPLGVTQQV